MDTSKKLDSYLISWGKPRTHLFKRELWSILPVAIKGLPDSFEFAGRNWEVKPEHKFHVSLINGGYVKEVIGDSWNEEDLSSVLQEACLLANPGVASIGPELRHCQHKEKNSIVVMCEISGLEELFSDLAEQLGAKFESPPTHITLYGQGIPLSTKQHLAERSEIIAGKELEQLKNLIGYEQVFTS